jgi:hypothetical protein
VERLAHLCCAGLWSGCRACCGMAVLGRLLGRRSAAADAQPRTQKRLHRKQTDDQGKDQPKGCGEEITHACTRTDPENLLLWPIM